MLLNWFVSSIAENGNFKSLISTQDLKNIGVQYCTHLLAAGVLRQISDKDAPTENVFKVRWRKLTYRTISNFFPFLISVIS